MANINNTKIDRYISNGVHFTPAVVCFPVKENKVLLMHRKKTTEGLGQDLVSGIGGKVGNNEKFKNETVEDAMIRECIEEIKLEPTDYSHMGHVKFIWETKPNWNMSVEIFVVKDWKGKPSETDVAKPVWHKIDKLPKSQMWEDNLHWVPLVLSGKFVDGVFLYGADKRIAEFRLN